MAKQDTAGKPTTNTNDLVLSKRPKETAIRQQKLKAWQPILDPVYVIAALFVIGVVFIPTGIVIQAKSNNLVEISVKYDEYNENNMPSCKITKANEGANCELLFIAPEDMKPPILVHYALENFYQNHKRYVDSRDDSELLGRPSYTAFTARDECAPLRKLGNITLNPCGLIANTLFNDVFRLESGNSSDGSPLVMIEDGIAWESDVEWKFAQPQGFYYEQCESCDVCSCEDEKWSCEKPYVDEDGDCYRYFYPNDDSIQYLYETYPMVVSPLEGVTNEHFIVWMRNAALPSFRKFYGYINQPIAKGERIAFNVSLNFEVESFKGSKSLILSTNNIFGGKNIWFGKFFLIVGCVSMGLAFFFGMKHLIAPRKLGDRRYLKYKEA